MTVPPRPLNAGIEVLPTGYHAGENGFAVTTIEKRADIRIILFSQNRRPPGEPALQG